MEYIYAATLQRTERIDTSDGEEVILRTIKKAGKLTEEQSGQNVVKAVLEMLWNVGNLVELEVARVA